MSSTWWQLEQVALESIDVIFVRKTRGRSIEGFIVRNAAQGVTRERRRIRREVGERGKRWGESLPRTRHIYTRVVVSPHSPRWCFPSFVSHFSLLLSLFLTSPFSVSFSLFLVVARVAARTYARVHTWVVYVIPPRLERIKRVFVRSGQLFV